MQSRKESQSVSKATRIETEKCTKDMHKGTPIFFQRVLKLITSSVQGLCRTENSNLLQIILQLIKRSAKGICKAHKGSNWLQKALRLIDNKVYTPGLHKICTGRSELQSYSKGNTLGTN